MAKTTLQLINAALQEIGEPAVTDIDGDFILHNNLLNQINNDVRDVLVRHHFRWGLARSVLTTTAQVASSATATATVTNLSNTVTSTDGDGVAANNFGSVTTNMWFRKVGDTTSYAITSIDTAASPDTVTLTTAYNGTTTTEAEYRFFQDTYAISTTGFDELIIAQYGEARTVLGGGLSGSTLLDVVDIQYIHDISGGDLHRDTSGKPRYIAEFGSDASDNPNFILWPYPNARFIIELRYAQKYTTITASSTTPFGTDAPDIAYDIVEAGTMVRACLYDDDKEKAAYWSRIKQDRLDSLMQRENRIYQKNNQMQIYTGRETSIGGMRVESQIFFDTRGAIR